MGLIRKNYSDSLFLFLFGCRTHLGSQAGVMPVLGEIIQKRKVKNVFGKIP